MKDLSDFICFQAVYQNLSISKAANKLNLSKASVSKKIQSLEAELGSSLFIRSTRQVVPTKEADLLSHKIEDILSTMDDIDSLFSKNQTIKGKIRVTSGHSMAQKFFGEVLFGFQKKFPEIQIELIATDNVLDPIENDIDISLRVNPPELSSLVGKKIGDYQVHLVASPKYLQKHPLKKIDDIHSHTFFAIDAHLQAQFETGKKVGSLIKHKAFTCNDSVLIGKFIREGKGIGLRSNWDIKTELKNGQLKEVLPSHALKKSGDVWLLSHPSKLKTPRVSALFNYLEEHLRVYF